MEFTRKSLKMKKRFEEKVSSPLRDESRLDRVTVRSFPGRKGGFDKKLVPYVEVDGIDGEWITASQARRLAKSLLLHADRIKRYKKDEDNYRKSRATG